MCFAYGVSVESVDVKVDARREVTRCAFRAASRGHFPALRDSCCESSLIKKTRSTREIVY